MNNIEIYKKKKNDKNMYIYMEFICMNIFLNIIIQNKTSYRITQVFPTTIKLTIIIWKKQMYILIKYT